jgi:hypothetical protein
LATPVLVGIAITYLPPAQRPQVLQLEAPQLAQELPVPAMRLVSPLSFLEKEAQAEIMRSALL